MAPRPRRRQDQHARQVRGWTAMAHAAEAFDKREAERGAERDRNAEAPTTTAPDGEA
ncbi:MAG: hypothetical protein ACHP84_05230 [Caulobacterales bacterium]